MTAGVHIDDTMFRVRVVMRDRPQRLTALDRADAGALRTALAESGEPLRDKHEDA